MSRLKPSGPPGQASIGGGELHLTGTAGLLRTLPQLPTNRERFYCLLQSRSLLMRMRSKPYGARLTTAGRCTQKTFSPSMSRVCAGPVIRSTTIRALVIACEKALSRWRRIKDQF